MVTVFVYICGSAGHKVKETQFLEESEPVGAAFANGWSATQTAPERRGQIGGRG